MIADAFATVLFDGMHPLDPALASWWGGAPTSTSGARVDAKSVLGLAAVFRAVNLIGNGVAKCRPYIYERLGEGGMADPAGRDKRRATEHPAMPAMTRRANQWMSASEFRKTLTAHAILRGNGIAYIERDASGAAIEYIPLLPDRTGMAVLGRNLTSEAPIPSDAEILYWTYVEAGKMRYFLPENILHIRGLSHNGVWGLDVVEVMRETLGLSIAARECGARFYGQGMLQSGVLFMPAFSAKGPKSEEAEANFIKSIKDQAQGLGKAHKLLVVGQGAEYKTMSVDPQAAQALETREFGIREIAAVIGCQAHKLGDTKRTSYASLEQSNQEHLDDDIDPWLARWEEAYEEVALLESEKESGSHFVECNRKALLRTNLAARGSYYTQARNGGWMSANDIRRAEGEDPIGPQGDTYLQPLNMAPAGKQDGAKKVINDDGEESKSPLPLVSNQLAAEYRALATHECSRLIKRTCDEAVRRSSKGGAEFLAFLDSIDTWCQEPAPLKPTLSEVGSRMRAELNKFCEPPYAAADLAANVAASIETIRADASYCAAALVEKLTTNN